MKDLEGRVIVVTGSAGGIGAACVRRFQERGAVVVGIDIRRSEADRHLERDLADVDWYDDVIEAIDERPLYALVNNAAASTTLSPEDLSPTEFDRLVAVNLRAPYFLSERLLGPLSTSGGRVVHVASVHAFATSRGATAYAATKGGLVALARAQAVDWAARGMRVRVNAVAPGAVDTPMLRDGLARAGLDIETLAGRHPRGKVASADEVAAIIDFLLSDDGAAFHGATLTADGGALAQLSTEVSIEDRP